MKKGLKHSIAAALAVASVAVFSGCIHDGVDSATTAISGVAVDGYISGATVTYGSRSTTTDSSGAWSLSGISDSDFGGTTTTLNVTGGTDSSTGEAFEGTLTSLLPETTSDTTVVITPISTLVQKYVANNSGTTIASAKSTMATTLGVTVSDLDVDPVANISTTASQNVYKAILKVQKIQEAMTDAGVSDPFSELSKKVTSSTTSIDTVIDNTIADTSIITDSNVRSALEAVQTSVKSVLNTTTITDTSAIATVAKTADAATKETETLLAAGNYSGAASKAKAVALIVDEIKTSVTNGNDVATAAAVIDNFNTTTLASSYDTLKSDAGSSDFDSIIEKIAQGTGLTDAVTEVGVTVSDSTVLTNAENAIASGEAASASSSTPTLAVTSIQLGNINDANTSNDINISTSSSSEINITAADFNLSDFYDVNFSDSNVSTTFTTQTVSISIILTNKADTRDRLSLTAEGIQLSNNTSTTLKTTLPVGAKVTIKESIYNGSATSATTNTYTLTLSKAIENTDFSFNLGNVIDNLSSSDKASITSGLDSMNTKFKASSGKNYSAVISIGGLTQTQLKLTTVSYNKTININ